MTRFLTIKLPLFIVFIAANILAFPHNAYASSFDPTRIIDDVVFYNKSSMSVQDIQNFLNSKVQVCDTNGTKSYAGTTRAAYSASKGKNTIFTCVKDYYENPTTHANNLNGAPIPSGAISAAQILYDAAQQYNINPQTLIVIMQREQGLITDDWPWVSPQYDSAMGYGCPDNGPNHSIVCSNQYFGFYNQVSKAAWQLQRYATYPTEYNYVPGSGNYVQWSPQPSCGGTVLNIQNQATASLYNYAPYQPNAAALNAGYGTGDACSAYANRNFWLYFSDWFGSVHAVNGNITLSHNLTTSTTTVTAGETVNAWYEVSNSASYPIDAGGLGICARLNGAYYDFGFSHHNTIPANGKLTLSYSKMIDNGGALNLYVCSYNELLGGWASKQYPYNSNLASIRDISLNVQDNPLITTSVSLSPAAPAIGQPVTATITLHNSGNASVNIGSLIAAGRDSHGGNVDFPIANDVIVPAGGDLTYSKVRTFTQPGTYTFYIANWNGIWSTAYPKSANGSIVRSLSAVVQDNPLITTSVSLSPAAPSIGQPTTATITLHNASSIPINIGSLVIAGRTSQGGNVDFPIQNDVIIPAGGDFTYSKTRSFSQSDTYNFFVANWNGIWSTAYPKSANGSIVRSLLTNIQ